MTIVAENLDERVRRQHVWSVNNDDEPFKTAAVAVAREQMTTARSMWASEESRLALQIKLMSWTCKARRPLAAVLQGPAKRRPLVLFTGKSFFDAVFNGENRSTSTFLH